jgi:PAS domain S-box-containing protein
MMSLEDAYQLISNDERERSFLITDPNQKDNPIIFANDAFVRLTGYQREEVLGRNCRFLQGTDTNPETVCALRGAIKRGQSITVDILNYKKKGTPFWNRLRIRPLFSPSGDLAKFVAVQNPIPSSQVDEVPRFSL